MLIKLVSCGFAVNFGADWFQLEQKSDETFNTPNLFDEMPDQNSKMSLSAFLRVKRPAKLAESLPHV